MTKEKIVDELNMLVKKRLTFFDKDSEMLDEKQIDLYAEKINKLLFDNVRILNPDFVLETVTHLGCWPQCIYDDDGHWAITESGTSNLLSDIKEDYYQTIMVTDHKSWKDTIKEAVVYYIIEYEND